MDMHIIESNLARGILDCNIITIQLDYYLEPGFYSQYLLRHFALILLEKSECEAHVSCWFQTKEKITVRLCLTLDLFSHGRPQMFDALNIW